MAQAADGAPGASALGTTMAAIVDTGRHPASSRRVGALGASLRALYAPAWSPRWFEDGRATAASAAAAAALREADAHGLVPADYESEWLSRQLAAAALAPASEGQIAQIEVALSWGLLRLLQDLHGGRLAVVPLVAEPAIVRRPYDPVAVLRDSRSPDAIAAAVAAAPPAFAAYKRLVQARRSWKALAERERPFSMTPWRPAPAPEQAKAKPTAASGAGRRPGDAPSPEQVELAPAVLQALADRLRWLGDLRADAPAGTRFSGPVSEALRHFQARHGLQPDGVPGAATVAALAVPARARVAQIDLALERLRWLPEIDAERVVAVNVPEFRLWAFRRRNGRVEEALTTEVIVGKQGRTATPLFIGSMRAVEFSPYWNVPPSIANNELVPALRRDPGYLARENMELVGDGGTVTTEVSERTLSLLQAGRLRARQRPGPRNALGGVKFSLPNSMNIYLHDTPARELFERTRRDFSHGCIRVKDPARLAAFVLEDRPQWNAARIAEAMAAGRLSSVPLSAPVPVIVFYTTVDFGADGAIRFLPDLYGHDAALARALAER